MTTVLSNAAADTLPSRHHNQPPLEERLKIDHEPLLARIDGLAGRANTLPKEFASDDDLKVAADIVSELRKLASELDDAHKAEKEPFLRDGRIVDGFFGSPKDADRPRARVQRMRDVIQQRADKLQAKRDAAARAAREAEEAEVRRKAEEARQAAEKAAADGRVEDALADLKEATEAEQKLETIAEQPAAFAPPVRSESGVSVGAAKEWAFEVQDYDKIPLDKLRPYIARAEIDKALRAYLKLAKGTAKLDGVRFFERTKTNFGRG